MVRRKRWSSRFASTSSRRPRSSRAKWQRRCSNPDAPPPIRRLRTALSRLPAHVQVGRWESRVDPEPVVHEQPLRELTTLRGQLIRVGGVTPAVRLRDSEGRDFSLEASKDDLRALGDAALSRGRDRGRGRARRAWRDRRRSRPRLRDGHRRRSCRRVAEMVRRERRGLGRRECGGGAWPSRLMRRSCRGSA